MQPTTEVATATEQVLHVPISDLRESPTNPRKHLGDLTELSGSIAKVGVLQPIVARSKPGHLEIVFGHRRWKAAQRAELRTLPVLLREMSDDEVLEAQIVENSQREDVHPLDEADGFAVLVSRSYTVTKIAERIGRSVAHVVQRLKLRELVPEARKALDDDQITLGAALLLARIPDRKLQREALQEALPTKWEGAPTVADLRERIEEQFMHRLSDGGFDLADEKLVPKAGPCTTCPHRTGQQRELFGDVKSPDVCTNPPCFRSKVDAAAKVRIAAAKKQGVTVLTAKEAMKALSYAGGFKRLDEDHWTGERNVKVRSLVKDAGAPVTLAMDDKSGKLVEIVREKDVQRIAAEKYPKAAKAKSAPTSYAERQKREERKLKLRRKAIRLAIGQAVAKAGKLAPADVLELVVRAFAARSWNEVQRAILDRRGIEAKGDTERQLLKLVKDANTTGDVAGIGLELAMLSGAPMSIHGMVAHLSAIWRDALQLAEVDFAALEKAVAADAKAKAKKPKKPAPTTGGTVVHLQRASGTSCGAKSKNITESPAEVTCKNCHHTAGIRDGAFIDDAHERLAKAQMPKPARRKKGTPKPKARKGS